MGPAYLSAAGPAPLSLLKPCLRWSRTWLNHLRVPTFIITADGSRRKQLVILTDHPVWPLTLVTLYAAAASLTHSLLSASAVQAWVYKYSRTSPSIQIVSAAVVRINTEHVWLVLSCHPALYLQVYGDTVVSKADITGEKREGGLPKKTNKKNPKPTTKNGEQSQEQRKVSRYEGSKHVLLRCHGSGSGSGIFSSTDYRWVHYL